MLTWIDVHQGWSSQFTLLFALVLEPCSPNTPQAQQISQDAGQKRNLDVNASIDFRDKEQMTHPQEDRVMYSWNNQHHSMCHHVSSYLLLV